MTKIVKSGPELGNAEQLDNDDPTAPAVGRWFWVNDTKNGKWNEETGEHEKIPYKWLGCVTHIGSNYVELRGPSMKKNWGDPTVRVHFENFHAECQREPNAEALIKDQIAIHQGNVRKLMGKVQELTARLGVAPAVGALPSGSETQALALRGAGADASIKDYKKALAKAKEKTLPDLFEQIEAENSAMAGWMGAPLIPLRAQASALKPVIQKIEDRIFNVELYAGLTEEVAQIADGAPAAPTEPVRLFQRRAYMDEECLANYRAGGMVFKHLRQFDAWIAAPENRDRLLPFPRCVLAFKVRRREAEREVPNLRAFINIVLGGEAKADELTFLYLRNGEKLFRLSTSIDFGAQLYPDLDAQTLLTGQLYAYEHGAKLVTQGQYEQMVKDEAEKEAKAEAEYQQELAEYPAKLTAYKKAKAEYDAALARGAKPIPHGWIREEGVEYVKEPIAPHQPWKDHVWTESHRYSAWNKDNVYYDDIAEAVKKQIDQHNRLVLVLQGLLDRSPVFHPHPPWQLWTEAGFKSALTLVYDDSRALTPGEAPDFEAYRQRLNESLKAGSIVVGQEEYWERIEATRENGRYRRGRRSDFEYQRYRPHGNPGPGTVARVEKISKAGCLLKWTRERQGFLSRRDRWSGKTYRDRLPCSLIVPSSALLNVDAYKPGDFKQFFNDPRTRADYLKWAPLLLEAEEYHAGNRTVGKSEEE